MMRILPVVLALAAGLSMTAGCARPASSAPASAVLPLSFSRTGGFAGRDDRLSIDAGGTVTVTNRGASGRSVRLDDTRLAALERTLSGVRPPSPAPASAPACADGFHYEVRTPSWTRSAEDCARGDESFERVLEILVPLLDA